MRLTNKVIEEVVSELAGPDILPLVALLRNKTNVSEFTLAQDLGAEINQTRNMLYRLYDHSLVSFTRRKDKKKGWYIYFWTFNITRAKALVKDIRFDKYQKLKDRLAREKGNQFFFCDESGIRLDFEQASKYKFKCPETGLLMEVQDNSHIVKKLETQLAEVEKQIIELKKEKNEIPKAIEIKKKVVKKKTKKKKKAKKKTRKKTVKKKPIKKKTTKKKTTKKKAVKKKVSKQKTKKKTTKKKVVKTAKKKTTKKKVVKKKTTKKKAKRKK